MAQLYNVDSPINREQRNNLNSTFQDILIRFSNLRYQISILSGGEDLENIIQTIQDAITEANNTTADTQQVLNDISDAMNQLNDALQNSQNATNNANLATDNANNAVNEVQNEILNIQSLINDLGNAESYDGNKTYRKNNIVEYNGSSFIAIQTTQGNNPPLLPEKRNDYWQLLSQRGIDGTGSVSSVNSISPDVNGNIVLSPLDIGTISSNEFTNLENRVNGNFSSIDNIDKQLFEAQGITRPFDILDYVPPGDTQRNSFYLQKDNYSSTGGTQKSALFVRNAISPGVENEEVGIFSVLDVYSNKEHHVGIYSQVNANGEGTTFLYGGCIEVKNTQPDGSGATTNQALIGLEIDIVNKYEFDGTNDPTTRKTGLSVVAFGGGTSHEALAIYSSGGRNGDGTYMTGDWLNGIMMHPGSIDINQGTAINIQADNSTAIKVTGKSNIYGIDLSSNSLNPGSVGLNINGNYSVAIAVNSDRFIKLNGAASNEGIFFDSVSSSFAIAAPKLALINHIPATTATAGQLGATPNQVAGYIKCFVDGVERRIPYYNV